MTSRADGACWSASSGWASTAPTGRSAPAPAQGVASPPRRRPRLRHHRPAGHHDPAQPGPGGHHVRADPAAVPQQRADRGAGARYVSTQQTSLVDDVAAYGQYDLVFEATGYSPIVFDAMCHTVARNGILILASVTGGMRTSRSAAESAHVRPGSPARPYRAGRHIGGSP